MEKESKGNMEGKDPSTGRFIKGEYKGGPGRPKGRRNYATLYSDALEEYAKMNGKDPDDIENLILQVALKKAALGDYSFYRDTMDRLHGKPQQFVDHTSKGEAVGMTAQGVTTEQSKLFDGWAEDVKKLEGLK